LQETERRRIAPPTLSAASAWPQSAVDRLSEPNAIANLLLSVAATAFLFAAVLAVTALNQHLLEGKAGAAVVAIRAMVPVTAASVAVLCVYRPWPAFLAVLALTPVWNTAAMTWSVGPIQVIFQTIFAAALIAGCLIRAGNGLRRLAIEPESAASRRIAASWAGLAGLTSQRRFAAHRFAEMGVLGIVGLGILSSLASPDPINSATVLLHGILEPVAMGAVLVWLRPSRRDLVLVAAALASAIAIGTLINIVQTLPQYRTLAALQAFRTEFAWATYYNVGLFGVIVAMIAPLAVGLLAARRSLRLSSAAVALLVGVLALGVAGLFFSFSKSAWVATAGGTGILLLLLVRTWRHRAPMLLGAVAVSAILIPWPAFVLQAVPPVNNAYRTVMVELMGEARFDSWNPFTAAGHGSLVERYYAIEGGINMALDHPALGVGLNEFKTYYVTPGYKPAQALDTHLDHAHSLFPEVAAELGIIALTLLIVVFAAALWAMWRTYRSARDDLTRTLAASILAGITAWLIAATAFGCDIYRPERDQGADVVAIAVLIAMAVALARTNRTGRDSTDGPQAFS
jgi:O-antigen ligase